MSASPIELLARGRRLLDELAAWLNDMAMQPRPDPNATVSEESPAWLLVSLRDRMAQLLDGRMPRRSCAWCQAFVLEGTARCPACHHEPHKPRVQCGCEQCQQGNPVQITEADLQAVLGAIQSGRSLVQPNDR